MKARSYGACCITCEEYSWALTNTLRLWFYCSQNSAPRSHGHYGHGNPAGVYLGCGHGQGARSDSVRRQRRIRDVPQQHQSLQHNLMEDVVPGDLWTMWVLLSWNGTKRLRVWREPNCLLWLVSHNENRTYKYTFIANLTWLMKFSRLRRRGRTAVRKGDTPMQTNEL